MSHCIMDKCEWGQDAHNFEFEVMLLEQKHTLDEMFKKAHNVVYSISNRSTKSK